MLFLCCVCLKYCTFWSRPRIWAFAAPASLWPFLLGSCWEAPSPPPGKLPAWWGPGPTIHLSAYTSSSPGPTHQGDFVEFGEQVFCRSGETNKTQCLSIRASHKYYFRRADVHQTSIFIRSETARRYVYSGLGSKSALVAGMRKIDKNWSAGWVSTLNPQMCVI